MSYRYVVPFSRVRLSNFMFEMKFHIKIEEKKIENKEIVENQHDLYILYINLS